MNTMNTQLTLIDDFKQSNIIYSKVQTKNIPNSQLTYKTIQLSYNNPNGTIGDLVLPTERCFSFGVSENTDAQTSKVTGYSVSLCLWDKSGATDAQKKFTDTFDSMCDTFKDYLVENKKEIQKFTLTKESDSMAKVNPLYWKVNKETGEIMMDKGPMLYPKLMTRKKDDQLTITSLFYDSESQVDLDPYELLNKKCVVRCALKLESIYISKSISLQVKLWDAQVTLLDTGIRRLLPMHTNTDSNTSESFRDDTLPSRSPSLERQFAFSIRD